MLLGGESEIFFLIFDKIIKVVSGRDILLFGELYLCESAAHFLRFVMVLLVLVDVLELRPVELAVLCI